MGYLANLNLFMLFYVYNKKEDYEKITTYLRIITCTNI